MVLINFVYPNLILEPYGSSPFWLNGKSWISTCRLKGKIKSFRRYLRSRWLFSSKTLSSKLWMQLFCSNKDSQQLLLPCASRLIAFRIGYHRLTIMESSCKAKSTKIPNDNLFLKKTKQKLPNLSTKLFTICKVSQKNPRVQSSNNHKLSQDVVDLISTFIIYYHRSEIFKF